MIHSSLFPGLLHTSLFIIILLESHLSLLLEVIASSYWNTVFNVINQFLVIVLALMS